MTSYLFFLFSLLSGLVLFVEGCRMLLLKRQITPFPALLLSGWSGLVSHKPVAMPLVQDRRLYASYDLAFGASILVLSFVYLVQAVL